MNTELTRQDLPRVAAIHDLSCFGRCALTVILPTLSAMGIQTIPIPTALLSTHTGGFQGMHFLDLSASMKDIVRHFTELRLHFDALYSGFLGSVGQIDIVEDIFNRFSGEETLVLVDPVMGDDGALYSTYTEALQNGMRRLCRRATVITPNLTEACFLAGIDYRDTTAMTFEEAKNFAISLCRRLHESYHTPAIVLTGVPFDTEIGVSSLDARTGQTHFYSRPRLPKSFPGTGDIFASVLLGRLLENKPLSDAVESAADFTSDVIAASQNCTTPQRDGVLLEKELPGLWK